MSNQELKVFKPFGPSIAMVKIPEKIVNELNNYVDNISSDEKKLDNLDHGKNLAGNVKQEFRLESDFMEKSGWAEFLAKGSQVWITNTAKKKISNFNIISSWVVRQFKNDYNPTHYHSGHISGVGYLKVPKKLGVPFQKNKPNLNGKLQLIHGSRMFMSNSTFNIQPEVGNFYFFPNYLMHLVYPFVDTDEERRSVSFNAKIDDSVYDVYGETYE